MRTLGQAPTASELDQMINETDVDGNGELDFQEFLTLMAKMQDVDPFEGLLEAFKEFDRDGDGTISAKELYHILRHLGECLPEEEAVEMVKEAKVDENGQIDYVEFIDTYFACIKPD